MFLPVEAMSIRGFGPFCIDHQGHRSFQPNFDSRQESSNGSKKRSQSKSQIIQSWFSVCSEHLLPCPVRSFYEHRPWNRGGKGSNPNMFHRLCDEVSSLRVTDIGLSGCAKVPLWIFAPSQAHFRCLTEAREMPVTSRFVLSHHSHEAPGSPLVCNLLMTFAVHVFLCYIYYIIYVYIYFNFWFIFSHRSLCCNPPPLAQWSLVHSDRLRQLPSSGEGPET